MSQLTQIRTSLLAVLMAAVACGTPHDQSDASDTTRSGTAPSNEDTVRVLYQESDVMVFSPSWDDTPKFLLFEPLAWYDAEGGGLRERNGVEARFTAVAPARRDSFFRAHPYYHADELWLETGR